MEYFILKDGQIIKQFNTHDPSEAGREFSRELDLQLRITQATFKRAKLRRLGSRLYAIEGGGVVLSYISMIQGD